MFRRKRSAGNADGAGPSRAVIAAASGRRRRRTALLVVAVAALSAVGGAVVGSRLQSPADAAAEREPPPASRITVPVERRVLTSRLVLTGEIAYQEPTPVRLGGAVDAPEGQTAVVTRPPVVAQELNEGDVLADISGRPVFMLVGEQLMYRTLAPGTTGDDVTQLEEALARLGFDPGPVDGLYDVATEGAVVELYTSRGYTASVPTAEDEERLQTLRQAVTTGEEAVRNAYNALVEAQAGKPESEMLQLRQAVDQARDGLTVARAAYQAVPLEVSAAAELAAVRTAEDTLELAQLQLTEAEQPPDVSTEIAAMEAANEGLAKAQTDLAAADETIGTKIAAGEVVFVPSLPLTVTEVAATAGGPATGTLATMSSTASEIVGRVARADVELLSVGQEATITVRGSGDSVPGTISYVGPPRQTETSEDGEGQQDQGSSPARLEVVVTPENPDALADDVFSSVRIEVQIGATDGEVLVVPISAVSLAADGSSQVEIERSPITAQSPGATERVTVEVGLTSEGLVEISAVDGELAEGDRVVVGMDDSAASDAAEAADADADADADEESDTTDDGDGG
jgi:peptidoglycan hydrolase-like protein with peptidoglycan-binding domain